MLHDRISTLVGSIYQAPYDPALWQRMTHDICAMLDCRALLVSAVDAKNHRLSSTAWYGPDSGRFAQGIEEYRDDLYRTDPTITYAARNPAARFCDANDIPYPVGSLTDEYMRWYRDRFQSPTFVVGYTPPKDGLTFGVSVHPGFENAGLDHTLFHLLFDHIARAVAIASRPPSLEREGEAVVLVKASGKVVSLSPLADCYLASKDGLRLEDGKVGGRLPADSAAIGRAIKAASMPAVSGNAGTALFIKRPSGRRDWLLSITPFQARETPIAAFQPDALIRIVDPSRQHALSDQTCALFGFTDRERQIAALLLNGHSPSSAARCLDISENTVKVHLQALYRKTQTNRQVEFVKLLLELG